MTVFAMLWDTPRDGLEPGQVLTSVRELARVANVSRASVESALVAMAQRETIVVEETRGQGRRGGGSVITSTQYEDYGPQAFLAAQRQASLQKTPVLAGEQATQNGSLACSPGHNTYYVNKEDICAPPSGAAPSSKPKKRAKKKRHTEPPLPWVPAFSDYLRKKILEPYPGLRINDDAYYKARRPSWVKQLDAFVRKDLLSSKSEDVVRRELHRGVQWVCSDQGRPDGRYRLIVQCPKALKDKWDQICTAMGTNMAAPRRTTPEEDGLTPMGEA